MLVYKTNNSHSHPFKGWLFYQNEAIFFLIETYKTICGVCKIMFYKITAAVFTCLSMVILSVRAICISILFSSVVQAGSPVTDSSCTTITAIFDNNTHLITFAVSSFIIGLGFF